MISQYLLTNSIYMLILLKTSLISSSHKRGPIRLIIVQSKRIWLFCLELTKSSNSPNFFSLHLIIHCFFGNFVFEANYIRLIISPLYFGHNFKTLRCQWWVSLQSLYAIQISTTKKWFQCLLHVSQRKSLVIFSWCLVLKAKSLEKWCHLLL